LEFGFFAIVGDAANDGELALHGAVELEEEMQCHILVWFRGFESTLMI